MTEGSGLLELRRAQLRGFILGFLGDRGVKLVDGVGRPDGQTLWLFFMEVDHGPVHVHEIDRRDRLALSMV